MAKRIGRATDREYYEAWMQFCANYRDSTPIDTSESKAEQMKRIQSLEDDPERWFSYYFPLFCSAPPAKFHKAATRRLMSHSEWYEVRAWSRELAKSSRSMMEICYLAMTGKVHNVLLVSNSHDNAEDLLLPFKAFFEANQRLIHDYGEQQRIGNWKSDKFCIRHGCAFRALGWGESPRGTRNNERRPDFILIDGLDTDEECRNEDVMKNKTNWVEQALIGTRSISNPTRILVNGNIIHEQCAVKAMGEKADRFDIINIRDQTGHSTWPEKNSEADIDRVLSLISYESAQKEYFNNPMDGGDTFKALKTGKAPRLDSCQVLIYCDPSTSNKDRTSGSDKAVGIIAKKGFDYYIVKAAVDTMSNAHFVDVLFDFYLYCRQHKAQNVKAYIENNTLQDPFYEQVLLPLIYQQGNASNVFLPVTPDTRKKPEKWSRIEGTLEPINRLGHLIFNEAETDEPGMKRLMAQFRNASRKQRKLDGVDMVEGGVFLLNELEAVDVAGGVEVIKRVNTKKW